MSVPYSAWKSGLCDLCVNEASCVDCCLAFWCPCFSFGQIAAAMTPGEVCCGGNYWGSCCLFCVLDHIALTQIYILFLGWGAVETICPFAPYALTMVALPGPSLQLFAHCIMRCAIRRKYNIPGDHWEDLSVVSCCPCCALVQVPPACIAYFSNKLYGLTRKKLLPAYLILN
jgi:Cys-rich protein (TIGR01571 family)